MTPGMINPDASNAPPFAAPWRPALYASTTATHVAMALRITMIQIVELSRDFITFLPNPALNF
jgi:hypothetical protein